MGIARGEWGFSIAADSAVLGTIKALRRALLEDPRAWIEFEPSLEFLASWLVDGKGRGAMLITADTAVAVWRSCRGGGPGRVGRRARRRRPRGRVLGMNLLVVEPAGKSISWMKQLARPSGARSAPGCPKPYVEDWR